MKSQKLVIYIKKENPFVFTRISEINIPEEHEWTTTGLKISDLSIYEKDCEVCFSIDDVKKKD